MNYSIEWKENQTKIHGGWPQLHTGSEQWGKFWAWHYISHGTEYQRGCYDNRAECIVRESVK
jgi:hypothetical protein